MRSRKKLVSGAGPNGREPIRLRLRGGTEGDKGDQLRERRKRRKLRPFVKLLGTYLTRFLKTLLKGERGGEIKFSGITERLVMGASKNNY